MWPYCCSIFSALFFRTSWNATPIQDVGLYALNTSRRIGEICSSVSQIAEFDKRLIDAARPCASLSSLSDLVVSRQNLPDTSLHSAKDSLIYRVFGQLLQQKT